VAVQPASLEILEKAQVPPAQARAIVQVIEIEIAGASNTLATKHDFLALHNDLTELRHHLELRIESVRGDLRTEMHAVAASTQRQMYGALLGQMAVLLGVAYFFVTHLPH